MGRRLIRLAIAAVGLFASASAGSVLVLLVLSRHVDPPIDAPFGGWQVTATEAGFGVLIAALAALSWVLSRRLFCGLKGRTAYRRVTVMLAFLPGLALGGALAAPMAPAVSWASEHTAQARAAKLEVHRWLVNYRKAPPVSPMIGKPAPPALGQLLLTAEDLGPHWYLLLRAARTVVQLSDHEQLGAHAVVGKEHWDGGMWHLDEIVSDSVYRFDSAADAREYVTHEWTKGVSGCGCPAAKVGPTTTTFVNGSMVWRHAVRSGAGGDDMAFVRGDDAFLLSIRGGFDQPPLRTSDVRRVMRAAVRRGMSAA